MTGLTAIIGSGGGGGGDEEPPPTTVLNYILSGPRAPVAALSVSGLTPNGAAGVSFPSDATSQGLPWLGGTYDSTTDDYTLASSASPIAWIDTSGAGAPFGQLEVKVTQTFTWNDGNDPTAGALTVTSRDGTFAGTIALAVTSSPSPGVNISLDGGSAVFYPWSTFDDLWTNEAAALWQRVASFTYSMRGFLYDQANLAIEGFTIIEDLFSAFEAGGAGSTIVASCSSGPPVPSGQTWANEVRVTWFDIDVSGTITNDDTFRFVFDNCWIDDPTDNIDQLVNGTMDFLHYDRHVQACPTYLDPGVIFGETDATGPIAGSEKTVSGGLCLFIPGI